MSVPSTSGKLVSKLLSVIAVGLFVVFAGRTILTNENTGKAFGALMGQLPFAKIITDTIVKLCKFRTSIPVYSTSTVLTDLIVLAVMATITPLVNGLLEKVFLPIPQFPNWRDQEDHMNSAGYKVKETILSIVTAPLLAVLSAWLTKSILNWFTLHMGGVMSIVVGLLLAVISTAVSLAPLVMGTFTMGQAIAWRVCITLLGAMAKTMVINIICLALYCALLAGSQTDALASVIAFFIVLVAIDVAFRQLRLSIANW